MENCARCGAPAGQALRCGSCGAPLLVDVCALPVTEPRVLFEGARALAALGAPAPAAAEAKRRLARGGVVLGAVSLPFAARAKAALAAHGIETTARASKRRSAVALIGAVTAAAIAGAVVFAAAHRSPPPAPVVAAAASAPVAPTAAEIAAKTLPSVVKLSCKDHIGTGFYVGPGTILTNAHVACPPGEPVRVRHSDGREVEGSVRSRDDWLDFARIEVRGEAVPPLSLGDATALHPGDAVYYVGTPLGLEFSLGQGSVAYAGRNLEGVAFVQLNAPIQPGNSGGPALDARGRVVGIVTLKSAQGEGIGFALPIEYAAPPSGAEAERWKAVVEKVQREDEELQRKVLTRFQKPRLVDVDVKGGIASALIIVHDDYDTRSGFLTEVRAGEGRVCLAQVTIDRWESLSVLDESKFREERWVGRGQLGKKLQVVAGKLDPAMCPWIRRGDEVLLVDGVEARGRVRLEEEAYVLPPGSVRVSRSLQHWRARFATAWGAVLDAEREALGQADAGVPAEEPLRALARARSELIELEKEASAQNVPAEWR